MNSSLLVTTFTNGRKNIYIWDNQKPIVVGTPRAQQWLLIKKENIIQIRKLNPYLDTPLEGGLSTIRMNELKNNQTLELPHFKSESVSNSTIQFHRNLKKFSLPLSNINEIQETQFPIELELKSNEKEFFKKSLGITFSVLLLLYFSTLFIPKPKSDSEELIPAQYTKLIMSPTQKSSSSQQSQLSKNVQKTTLVQAFQSKQLKSNINHLFKGGMSKLLAQSQFVMGNKNHSETQKIFETNQTALNPTANLITMTQERNTSVASLGGGENGGAGQGEVGYGKGTNTSLDTQGKGHIPYVAEDKGNLKVDEGLTKDEVGEIIHQHLSEIRYCYESSLIHSPDIQGKMMTRFTINKNGIVGGAQIISSSLSDSRLDDCILKKLSSWKFPNPRGGSEVAVSYPFVFKTLGR